VRLPHAAVVPRPEPLSCGLLLLQPLSRILAVQDRRKKVLVLDLEEESSSASAWRHAHIVARSQCEGVSSRAWGGVGRRGVQPCMRAPCMFVPLPLPA